ncbi:MAG: protease pro-enzyme activation domain-containing protein [Candidatus Acidiferrales bacterium]
MTPASVARRTTKHFFGILPILFLLLLAMPTSGQSTPKRSLITQPIDEAKLTILKGNTYPLATAEFDRGAAPPSLPLNRMLLVLKRSPEQETALDALLDQQQDKSSPNYHAWLTPEQFGQQFGPSDSDIQAVTAWLQSHGFQITNVTNGRMSIEFSGTTAQVQQAFHTSIHKYVVNGADHWANSSDPQIPAALAPAVAGIDTLHNFPRKSMHQLGGIYRRSKETGKAVPVSPAQNLSTFFTLPSPGGCGVQPADCYALSPYDFGTIYDVLPLWNASPKIDGTGQTIAVVAESNVDPNDINSFRKFFGLPTPANLNVKLSGPDPGLAGAETEADLDVEWAGAIAPNATIDLVVAESTEVSLGADLAAVFAVDNNLAPVLNVSFGICELALGTTGNLFFNQLWQQAAAQGITVDVSTGDSGAAVCDRGDGPPPAPAVFGLTVSGFSTTPYNVAIGGTDFNDLTDASTFWNLNNVPPAFNPTALATASARSYIPETTWNNTCTNGVFGSFFHLSLNAETNCNNPNLAGFVQAVGGSGGKSNCISSDGQHVSSCTGGYSKPTWQVGNGVPNDQARDVPDASLFASVASPSGSFYIICEADILPPGITSCDPTDPNTEFIEIGGTSASAPTFSAIMSLVNQKTGSRQGNANYILYKLAAQQPTAFHDVPAGGTIAMPCANGSPDCTVTNPNDIFGVLSGFSTTAGYDLATGLGSVDANNFVTKWDLVTTKGSLTTLNLSPTPVSITHGQSVNFTIDVAPAVAGATMPTGNVSIIANTGSSGQQGVQAFTLSNGTATGTTALLPGGNNYTVFAQYPGDGVFGPSTSSTTSVTVAPEPSKVQLAYELFDPVTNLLTNPNATTAVFGTRSILRVNAISQAGDACPSNAPGSAGCPTGSLMLTDSYNGGTANPLDAGTYPLNSLGYAEDQVIDLPGGTHSKRFIPGTAVTRLRPVQPLTHSRSPKPPRQPPSPRSPQPS